MIRIMLLRIVALSLFLSSVSFADKLIIEPEMGREPILNAILHTRQSLDLVMYGFTDKSLLDATVQQIQHGRHVKIILERNPYRAESQNNKAIGILRHYQANWQGDIPPFRFIHQKTLVSDGRTAIIMTFNFTKSTFDHERNFALVITDPQLVNDIESVFAADWNHQPSPPHSARLLYSPDDSRFKLISLIHRAKHSIKIYSQTIHDYQIIGALAEAARHGIDVKILISSRLRTKQVHYLAKAGVAVHQSHHYYIHAKVFIIDEKKAVIGSINLTRASLDDNRELSVVTDDPVAVKELNNTFNKDW